MENKTGTSAFFSIAMKVEVWLCICLHGKDAAKMFCNSCERKFMDQQNYELDQTGAEETPKKKKGSTVKGIVIGVIGTLLISWTGINVACSLSKP